MASFDLSGNNNFDKKPKAIKIWGISFVIVCSLIFLFLLTNFFLPIKSFLLGMFGLFIYPLSVCLFIIGLALLNNKKYVMPKKYIFYLFAIVLSLLAILNIIILGNPNNSFFEYLGYSYSAKYTAGGVLVGLIVAPFIKTLGMAGALIIYLTALVVFIALIVDFLHSIKIYGFEEAVKKKSDIKYIQVENLNKQNPVKKAKLINQTEKFELFVDNKAIEKENKNALIRLGLIEGNIDAAKSPEVKEKTLREHLLTPPEIDLGYFDYKNKKPRKEEINKNINILKEEPKEEPVVKYNKEPEVKAEPIKPVNYFSKSLLDENPQEILAEEPKQKKFVDLSGETAKETLSQTKHFDNFIKEQNTKLEKTYNFPPITLLDNHEVDLSTLNEDVVGKRVQLENTLETFGINAKVIGVVVGPSVTRYEIEMPQGVSVKKIVNLQDDISLALATRSAIRIEAPIPGKSAVGIEVPNENIATVSLREVLEAEEFKKNTSPVTFALGKNISGNVELCNLAKMPHILVAGATNSGKSICLNAIIISMIFKSSPEDIRLILVDPKRVEFSLYNDLPHLLIPKVITEVDMAVNAFQWCVAEMERRYELLQEARCRNSDDYNKMPEVLRGDAPKMPYIVVVVDELADLMSSNKKELEEHLRRLTQKARAAGILLVLATQRPSVDVITGTIKTNCPARISFALTSMIDSRTILDSSGAESLLGRGDMLYKPTDANTPRRVQGCFVSTEEVERIVDYIKDTTPAVFDEKIQNAIEKTNARGYNNQVDVSIGDPNWDPLVPQALKMFIEQGSASTSSIQRRFLTGFPRASRIVDQLCRLGYLSQPDGTKPREVLITMEQFIEKFGIID